MSSAKATVDVNVPPNEIWQLIGGFGSLPDWVPGVCQSKLTDGGRVRHLHDTQGHTFIERLEHYDAADHTYAYSILHSPISVSNYFSTIAVTSIDEGKGSHIEWSSIYTPVGVSEKEAEEVFRGLYLAALTALASRFASAVQPHVESVAPT